MVNPILPSHENQPSRQPSPVAEHFRIGDCRHDRHSGNRSHPLDRRDLPAAFVAGEDPSNPCIASNTLIKRARLLGRDKNSPLKKGRHRTLLEKPDRRLLSDLT